MHEQTTTLDQLWSEFVSAAIALSFAAAVGCAVAQWL